MSDAADRLYMEHALELARRGLGRTSPNPAVGAVIVADRRIAGRGWHEAAGRPHAEATALLEAGERARGATLYVTLEPCSHFGRTPPCADALVVAGVGRVVVAAADPNPAVAGRGIEKLRAAGIAVETGLCREAAERMNEGFNLSIVEKRAFVHLKLAATLDGRIAAASGDSRWVTSEESRARVHELRDRCGAVLVGVSTAAADDPRLTVRLPGREERRVLRAVLDPGLRIPPGLWMLSEGEAAHTVLFCDERASPDAAARLEGRGARVVRVPARENGLDLRAVNGALYGFGVMEVLAEGGARTARSLLDARLVDRCHFFYAPKLLGGDDGAPMVAGKGPERMADALPLAGLEVERAGPDLYLTGRPAWKD